MRNLSRLAAAAILASALILPAQADPAEGGATSADLLNLGWGARVPAIGGSMPAGVRGTDAAWYNPAGLALTTRAELSASYQSMIENINQGNIGYAQPWGGKNGVAVFLKYLDYGIQDRTTIATAGAISTVSRAGTFTAQDFVGGVAAGRYFGRGFSGGVALKIISSELDNVTATAFAADLGAEWKPWSTAPVTLGLTLSNLGTGLKYDFVSEELPLTVALGARAALFNDRLVINFGGDKTRYEDVKLRGGVELFPFGRMLALRAGYDASNDVGSGLTAGAGFMVEDFSLDYAYVPYGKLGHNHRVGLSVNFGAIREIEMPPPPAALNNPRRGVRRLKDRMQDARDSVAAPPRIYVDEFAVRDHPPITVSRTARSFAGAQELRSELTVALAARGLTSESPSGAAATIEGNYWVSADGSVTIDAVLNEGFNAIAKFQKTTTRGEMADAANRARLVAEMIEALIP